MSRRGGGYQASSADELCLLARAVFVLVLPGPTDSIGYFVCVLCRAVAAAAVAGGKAAAVAATSSSGAVAAAKVDWHVAPNL